MILIHIHVYIIELNYAVYYTKGLLIYINKNLKDDLSKGLTNSEIFFKENLYNFVEK